MSFRENIFLPVLFKPKGSYIQFVPNRSQLNGYHHFRCKALLAADFTNLLVVQFAQVLYDLDPQKKPIAFASITLSQAWERQLVNQADV